MRYLPLMNFLKAILLISLIYVFLMWDCKGSFLPRLQTQQVNGVAISKVYGALPNSPLVSAEGSDELLGVLVTTVRACLCLSPAPAVRHPNGHHRTHVSGIDNRLDPQDPSNRTTFDNPATKHEPMTCQLCNVFFV